MISYLILYFSLAADFIGEIPKYNKLLQRMNEHPHEVV